jgi:hypothetical protein
MIIACLSAASVALIPGGGPKAAALLFQGGRAPKADMWQYIDDADLRAVSERTIIPNAYRTLRLDMDALKQLLAGAPMEFTERARSSAVEISLPMPDGRMVRFKAVESPIMEPELAAAFPENKTYSGHGIDDPTASCRFDVTPSGFHAYIFSREGSIIITPYARGNGEHYLSYYRRDSREEERKFRCYVKEVGAPSRPIAPQSLFWWGAIRTYRYAAAATGEYTEYFRFPGDTDDMAKARVFDNINTIINGVNAIFEREVGIRLILIDNRSIIYTSPEDPYTCGNTDSLIEENQENLDDVIGEDNYDIGQVFDVEGGGLAAVASVCDNDNKGRGMTGNDIVVTAHETAHQFSAHHTFNDNANGSCAGDQYAGDSAYEPGSGSTIMSYCGNCSAANLQLGRDLYFHAKSILVMRDYIVNDDGEDCAQFVSTPNLGVELFLNQTHTIPAQTPFRLYGGDFNDPDPGDAILYCWEEYDLGNASPPEGDDGSRPIFRSYMPSRNPDRTFPSMQYVLSNLNGPSATYQCGTDGMGNPIICLTGEAMPTTTRTMSFALTLRDNVDAAAIDHLTVNIVSNSVPFLVPTPLAATVWPQGSPRTVTWTVGNSNQPPINCANVKITLSTDGGNTFPFVLAESTPNDGTETITVPQVDTNQARVKVEAVDNIFFNVSSGFTVRPPMVTTTDDGSGDNLSPVSGSLREALIAANNLNPIGGDPIPILFNIPGGATLKTINVVKELPQITKPVFLEGHSQGGAGYGGPPLIEISGAFATPPPGQTMVSGLRVAPSGAGSRLKGLTVNRFTGSGIEISGGMSVIDECYIGTDAAGAAAAGNAQAGVAIVGCSGNLLFHNLISGNDVGVQITGATATGNLLRLNSIGTDVNRTARIPNASDGIRITDSPGNTIGGLLGSGDSGGNVISGNGKTFSVTGVLTFADGIEINGNTASGNIIQGNRIGLNGTGTNGLDNSANGIKIVGAPNTIIGGTGNGEPNVIGDSGALSSFGASGIEISGNTASGTVIRGNLIGTDVLGTLNLGMRNAGIYIDNAPNTTIGGTTSAARNVISGAKNGGGIRIGGATATGTLVQGNFIGTNAAGTAAFGNNAVGIFINSANNTVGGTTPGARNVISGTIGGDGIVLSESGATGNTIQGNYIGTDVTGTVDLGNVVAGIRIVRATNNTIGGTTAAARNLISGNNNYGILLFGVSGVLSNNVIQGNYIGTDVTGNNALGNGIGVRIEDANNQTLGGSAAGAGNLISGNTSLGPGVTIFSNVAVTGIKVEGNRIGTNAAGTAALGNQSHGISISLNGNSAVTIGGSTPGARNIISANGLNGLTISGSVVTVQGNYIGTDVTGTANLGNAQSGVEVASGTGNLIGGAGANQGNVIAFNGAADTGFFYAGLKVFSTSTTIRGNSIFSNTGLGIDLQQGGGGVTPNDNCDADTGPNNLQNFPVLTSATNGVGSVAIEGALNSAASSAFTLDFYSSPACDQSGNGEGKTYLGSAGVTTGANCTASFTAENAIVLPNVTVPAGQVITATATDSAGNTSELSACILVTGLCGAISPASQGFGEMGGGGSVMINAAAGCGWTAVSNDSWIVIVSDAIGTGSGAVQFVVRENFAAASRTGTVTIAEQVFTVKQTGTCSYSINPSLQTVASGGGGGQFGVTTQNGCGWMAVSDSNWITVTAGTGVGNGTVSYTVAANPGPGGRAGTITAGGRVFTLKQKAP